MSAETAIMCNVPPDGWWCSREAGHDGPCAARRVRKPRLCKEHPHGGVPGCRPCAKDFVEGLAARLGVDSPFDSGRNEVER